MGDAKKSAYFHNRMADNIRETDESALKKLSIQNLKIIQSVNTTYFSYCYFF